MPMSMDQDNDNHSSSSSNDSSSSSSMETDDYEMDEIPSMKRVYSEDSEDSLQFEIHSRAKRRRLQVQPPAIVEGEIDQTMAVW